MPSIGSGLPNDEPSRSLWAGKWCLPCFNVLHGACRPSHGHTCHVAWSPPAFRTIHSSPTHPQNLDEYILVLI